MNKRVARAAATGGQPSTAAMTAASQAGDYYAGQLADKIPELYENAYQRYLSDYSLLTDQLGQTRQAEQSDYAKYLDELGQYNTDRALSYDQWLQGYNMLSDQAEDRALAQQQVDAILSAGGSPGAELVASSGYSGEYVQALEDYYRQQAALRRVSLRPCLSRCPSGSWTP